MGALAGTLTGASIAALMLGAWGWSLILGLPGAIIGLLLANDEIYLPLGPVRFLRSGNRWMLNIGRYGIVGIGWRVRLRNVEP
jgi:hypothetical protein